MDPSSQNDPAGAGQKPKLQGPFPGQSEFMKQSSQGQLWKLQAVSVHVCDRDSAQNPSMHPPLAQSVATPHGSPPSLGQTPPAHVPAGQGALAEHGVQTLAMQRSLLQAASSTQGSPSASRQ